MSEKEHLVADIAERVPEYTPRQPMGEFFQDGWRYP